MSAITAQVNVSNGVSSAHDLFALTDEQILQIEPDAQGLEVFGGERADHMDPLREDLELLASDAPQAGADGAARSNGKGSDDGLKAVAANAAAKVSQSDAAASSTANANGDAPQWLAERMNDPQHGADARALWDGVQLARQEASAFREVFAKPEDARVAAQRARTLDEIDRAYFGAPGNAPEQTSASRGQLATLMMREDPAAFREMVFAGLRALEDAGKQGTSSVQNQNAQNATVSAKPPTIATLSAPPQTSQPAQQPNDQQPQQHNTQPRPHQAQQQNDAQRQQDARIAAYASFERAANEDLERTVGGAISRTLQEALPHAARAENGAALKERLSGAIRQDVEKALQGDRALGEQVARILSGQRLDNAARAQVVRLIGDRAQQLVPSVTRRVLADWTQTTLSAHGARANRNDAARPQNTNGAVTNSATNAVTNGATSAPTNAGVNRANASLGQRDSLQSQDRAREAPRSSIREAATSRSPRKIDYRRISDEDILDS